ncbi:MAG: SDR family oxidoreductase [Chloroflexi bacterium]|nr:SDR family oxidoreductase [Chloroflexota bacterium]
MAEQVILITGVSSGMGKVCAEHLAARGHRVYGASRKPEALSSQPGFRPIRMDVTDDASVAAGVAEVLAEAGRIDVLVNNAGWGISGPIEDTTIPEAQALFETNFFGVLRTCRAVLPIMRRQGSGRIINIGSLGGRIGVPYQGIYTATKFALEGLTETLRAEVRACGLTASIIEPGDFHTGFTGNRRVVQACNPSSHYWPSFQKVMRVVESDETHGSDPALVAGLLERIIDARKPRLRYTVGMLYQRLAGFLKSVLPAPVAEWILLKYYRLL